MGQVNEFNARFPIVLLSLSVIPLVFFVTKKVSDKKTAMIVALIATFFPPLIVISQELRYYIIVAIQLLLLYLILWSNRPSFLFKWLAIAFLLYWGNNSTLLFSVVSGLIIFIYYFVLSIQEKNQLITRKNLLIIFISLVPAFFLFKQNVINILQNNFFQSSSLFKFNPVYLTAYGHPFLIILLVVSTYIFLFHKKNARLWSLIPTLLFVAILSFLNSRYSGAIRHTTFVMPIFLVLFSLAFKISNLFGPKWLGSIFNIMLFLTLISKAVIYFAIPNNHLLLKQEFTWTRANYRAWRDVEVFDDSYVLAMFPFITQYYVGKVDFGLNPNSSGIDVHTGVEFLQDLNNDILDGKCVQIFADYRETFTWNEEIKAVLDEDYELYRSRHVSYYERKNCRLNNK